MDAALDAAAIDFVTPDVDIAFTRFNNRRSLRQASVLEERCYGTAVALFVHRGLGWLANAGTLERERGQPGQMALPRARIARAQERGCQAPGPCRAFASPWHNRKSLPALPHCQNAVCSIDLTGVNKSLHYMCNIMFTHTC